MRVLPPALDPESGPVLYLTGERTLPGIPEEAYWFARHVAGYELATAELADVHAVVLDAGCGEGYGTSMLAAPGRQVIGVDLFTDAAAHAAAAYHGALFTAADTTRLPLPDAAFDAVVSLQVVEHVVDLPAYAVEMRRVLRPGGTFVCATPNRLTFTPPGRPKNPFHVEEFDAEALGLLLSCAFGHVRVTGLTDDLPGLADALIDAAFASTRPPQWALDSVPSVTSANFHETPDLVSCLDLFAVCSP